MHGTEDHTMNEFQLPPSGTAAALEGRRIRLVPLIPSHYEQIYALVLDEQNALRWRFQGGLPSLEVFKDSLLSGVFSQFSIVVKSEPDRPRGYCFAYDISVSAGRAYVAVLVDRAFGAGAIEAIAIYIRYVFDHWPFRKIYMESPEYNFLQYRSAVRLGLLREERRLKDHRYLLGRYWDEITLSIDREDGVVLLDGWPQFLGATSAGTGGDSAD
jgi:RimJ/RimL family protein N-acetyltransferase